MRRELPLLPLHTVLFPGAKLPLQIFEQRFVQLVTASIEDDRRLGVVLTRQRREGGGLAEPYAVGTIARIVHWDQAPDGHLTLMVQGEQRFRIVEIVQHDPFCVAQVEVLPNRFGALSPDLTRIANHLAALLYRYIELKTVAEQMSSADMMLPTDLTALGFRVGALLDVPLHEKQQLLETDDVTELLRSEVTILQREVRRLQRTAFWNEFLRTARARARAVPPEWAVWN